MSVNPSSTTLNANLNITPTGEIDWYGTGSSGTGQVILNGTGTLKLYNGNAFNGSTLNYTGNLSFDGSVNSLALLGLASNGDGSPALNLTNGSGQAVNMTLAPASGQTPNFYGSITGLGSVTIGGAGIQTFSQHFGL